jgi:putative zinc finger/helix-turn-helix YgiT family protein
MTEYYCDRCNKRVPAHVEEREEEFPVKGEPTKVLSRVRICSVCGNDIFDEELDSATLCMAFDLYRSRHNLMFPSELKAMREHYGLSQRSLAALLGWGEVTVHRYENGSLPDEAHNQLLHLLKYPENMLRIAQMNGERLPASARRKLFARLEELIGKDAKAAERTKSARTSKAALRGKNKKAKAPSHR